MLQRIGWFFMCKLKDMVGKTERMKARAEHQIKKQRETWNYHR